MSLPLEAITAIVGTVLPMTTKLIRSIFGKKTNQSPQDALDDVALSKPEILPAYVEALSKQVEAQTAWFNRDVSGDLSQWVRDLRSAIRPSVVACSFILLGIEGLFMIFTGRQMLNEATRAACTGFIGTWMGDRVSND